MESVCIAPCIGSTRYVLCSSLKIFKWLFSHLEDVPVEINIYKRKNLWSLVIIFGASGVYMQHFLIIVTFCWDF